MSALIIENLTVSYTDIHAVKGISFEVRQGEIFTLIGANGAGKSSALRAISGLLRFGGSVRLEGRELRGLPPEKIVSLGLSQVPEGRGIFGNLTVKENLHLGAWIRKDRKGVAEDLDRILATLPRLRERLNQPAGTLSGGEQQMLAVARALLSRATTLLLDEPSMGLAPIIVEEVFATICRLKKAGITLLLVEQMARMALEVADYAYVMERGRIVVEGAPEELRKNERVIAAYLGK